jgi:hypothetical protein
LVKPLIVSESLLTNPVKYLYFKAAQKAAVMTDSMKSEKAAEDRLTLRLRTKEKMTVFKLMNMSGTDQPPPKKGSKSKVRLSIYGQKPRSIFFKDLCPKEGA